MVHASYDQRHFAAILQSHGAKFRAIGLCEEELHLLYKKFGSMDTNGSGDIGTHSSICGCCFFTDHVAYTQVLPRLFTRITQLTDGSRPGEYAVHAEGV